MCYTMKLINVNNIENIHDCRTIAKAFINQEVECLTIGKFEITFYADQNLGYIKEELSNISVFSSSFTNINKVYTSMNLFLDLRTKNQNFIKSISNILTLHGFQLNPNVNKINVLGDIIFYFYRLNKYCFLE